MDTARANGTGRGVPIGEAAERLGLTTTAVRKRIKRGTLFAAKNDDGTWTVYLPDSSPGPSAGPDTDTPPESPKRDDRVAILKQENERLWQELERRSEELRRKDVLLAEFSQRLAEITQRLPELPAATSERANGRAPERLHEPSSAPSHRSWWKFWDA
jgi:DNA-directed RNA polymerase specialized sigma24 family protein